jgi:predicted nucleic acid-binding protein
MNKKFFSANNIAIDTGPLLIHAVGSFDCRKLQDVCLCEEPDEEFEFLNKLFLSRKTFYITPYILSELFYRIRKELNLDEKGIEKFFNIYGEFLIKIGEFNIEKEKIITHEKIKFGLADISLILANKKSRSLIFSSDAAFCKLCEHEKIEYINYRLFFYNRSLM